METGTFYGDMLAACRKQFKKLYSIEYNKQLFLQARERFSSCPNVILIPGDSAQLLSMVLKAIDEPALFWLDAHAMEGVWDGRQPVTPILGELNQLLDFDIRRHVILIDDARLFRPESAYPTLSQVRQMMLHHHPDWIFEVKDDVIRAHVDSNR